MMEMLLTMKIEGWENLHTFLIWKCRMNENKLRNELSVIKIKRGNAWQDLADGRRNRRKRDRGGYENFFLLCKFWLQPNVCVNIANSYIKQLLRSLPSLLWWHQGEHQNIDLLYTTKPTFYWPGSFCLYGGNTMFSTVDN